MSNYTGRSKAVHVDSGGAVGYASVAKGAPPAEFTFDVGDGQLALVWYTFYPSFGNYHPIIEPVSGAPWQVEHFVDAPGVGHGWLTGSGTYRVEPGRQALTVQVLVTSLGAALYAYEGGT